MMDNYMKVSVNYSDGVGFKTLEKELGAEGVAALFRLWAYIEKSENSGTHPPSLTPEGLGIVASFSGDHSVFGEVVLRTGLVSEHDGVLCPAVTDGSLICNEFVLGEI